MRCGKCGTEMASGSLFCSACGSPLGPVPPAGATQTPSPPDPVESIVQDAVRTARAAALAAARLSKKALEKTDVALQHPGSTAKNVARRAIKELDAARKELEQAIRDLK